MKMSESEYESESEYDEAERLYSDIGKFPKASTKVYGIYLGPKGVSIYLL